MGSEPWIAHKGEMNKQHSKTGGSILLPGYQTSLTIGTQGDHL